MNDIFELALQETVRSYSERLLTKKEIALLLKAIANLRPDWFDKEEIFPIRAAHLFAPHLIKERQERVFLTHLLFLRDILENGEINEVLHSPCIFVAPKLAHFLFRNFPIHIHFKDNLLRSLNHGSDFVEIGGLLIAEATIQVDMNAIAHIATLGSPAHKTRAQTVVGDIETRLGCKNLKVAAQEISFDVFSIDEHSPALHPKMLIWDKQNRQNAEIIEIEQGETGLIHFRGDDGSVKVLPVGEFQNQCVVLR